jgi:hypothetical protein
MTDMTSDKTVGSTVERDAVDPGTRGLTAKITFFSTAGLVMKRIHDLLLLSIFIAVVMAGLASFKDIDSHLAAVRWAVPTSFQGHDIAPWLLFVLVYLLAVFFGVSGTRFAGKAELLGSIRADRESPDYLLRKAASGGKLKRKELLEVYVEAKKAMESQKRQLAFLSIDVVDSTGMKVGEEQSMAERDFIHYKKMVEAAIEKNRALKSTWTPDGVMICFGSTADAIRSGQELLARLEKFNREEKVIKRNFSIRAGINAGQVFYDDATPMEEMTDRVIDIAGHMQKHGCVDGLTIGKHAIEPLLGEFKFSDAGRVVDGCPVYEWRPQA